MQDFIKKIITYFTQIPNRIEASSIFNRVVNFLKSVSLPGFGKVPIYEVIIFFFQGLNKSPLSMRAAAASFNIIMAIFPAIVFFFTIIPYIPVEKFQDTLLGLLQGLIPEQAYGVVESTLFDIIMRPRSGLLSIGFVLAFFFSTNGIISIIQAFNFSHHVEEKRSGIKVRIMAILLVLMLSGIIITAIVLISIGPKLIRFVASEISVNEQLVFYIIFITKSIISIALFYFVYSTLYYFCPVKPSRYKFISPGSTLATVLVILTTVGFNFYLNNFSRYNSLYGSIGTLLVIMLWVYLNVLILLIGYELNISIKKAGTEHQHEHQT